MEYADIERIAAKYNKPARNIGAQNDQIKWLNDIINNKRPNPRRVYVIEGVWAHQKALECGVCVNSVYICPEMLFTDESLKLAEEFIRLAENVFVLSKKVYAKISEFDHESGGIISAVSCEKNGLSDIELGKTNLVVVLDGVEIPGNAGTILRSVDGAGGDAVIFCNKKIRLNHPKLIRSSQCACFSVPVIECGAEELIPWLKDNGFEIILLDTESQKEYHEIEYGGRVAIIAGSERYGISKEWYEADHDSTFIPMLGKADSLNVAVAATIVIYEAVHMQRKRVGF